MFIPDPDLDLLPIPNSWVKKAPNPGSGSATLLESRVRPKEVSVVFENVSNWVGFWDRIGQRAVSGSELVPPPPPGRGRKYP